jgi:isoamylase
VPGRRWLRAVDTAQTSPLDIADPGGEPAVAASKYTVQGRSVVVLVNHAGV